MNTSSFSAQCQQITPMNC